MIAKRISILIEALKISSIRSFEQAIGASNGLIRKAIANNTDIQSKWLSAIVDKYPRVSAKWLLSGNGAIFIESLADRISEIITDLKYDSSDNIAKSLGLNNGLELGNFTNNFVWPSRPFDFVKFLNEYPEYNYEWILTGDGSKFHSDEAECLKAIHERIYHKNHPELFPNKQPSSPSGINERDSYLWKQILSQNEQLREKDAQIKEKDSQINQLLKILESSSK